MATYAGNADLMIGNDFLFYLYDGETISAATPIAYSTNASIEISAEEIEANNKFSCRWANKLNGNASYSISCDSMYTQTAGLKSFDALMEQMTAANAEDRVVYWAMGPEVEWTGSCETNTHQLDTSATYYYGQGAITSLSLNASLDEICDCSVTISGSGPINKSN